MSDSLPNSTPPLWKTILKRGVALICSYGLAVVLLLYLALLTLLGTLAQHGGTLYDAQKKYFDSIFFLETIRWGSSSISFWLPGAYLVLAVLGVNMFAGGIVRIILRIVRPIKEAPDRWLSILLGKIGIIITHFSMLGLIVAGAVSFHKKREGNLALYPGQQSNVVQAYNDWQLEIRGDQAKEVLVIRDKLFSDCVGEKSRTFYRSGLPFKVKVSHYHRNADPTVEGDRALPKQALAVDRYALLPLPESRSSNEANRAGILVEVIDANSGASLGKSLLVGEQTSPTHTGRPPWVVNVGGNKYAFTLFRERWQLPFTVRVDKFDAIFYEGTNKAKSYESRITKIETKPNGTSQEEAHLIEMNKPLRHANHILFQGSYGKASEDATDYYTVFVAVFNPSDQWPTYCTYMIGFGLLVHFIYMLVKFTTKHSRRTVPASAEASTPPTLPVDAAPVVNLTKNP